MFFLSTILLFLRHTQKLKDKSLLSLEKKRNFCLHFFIIVHKLMFYCDATCSRPEKHQLLLSDWTTTSSFMLNVFLKTLQTKRVWIHHFCIKQTWCECTFLDEYSFAKRMFNAHLKGSKQNICVHRLLKQEKKYKYCFLTEYL